LGLKKQLLKDNEEEKDDNYDSQSMFMMRTGLTATIDHKRGTIAYDDEDDE
jgi:hypothetical protein